jgi:hypothetical protein
MVSPLKNESAEKSMSVLDIFKKHGSNISRKKLYLQQKQLKKEIVLLALITNR